MKFNSLKLFDGFLFSDLKYLMAYSIPLTAIFGFYMGGYWLLTTPIYILAIIPISEYLLTFLKIDDLENGRINKSTHWIFDLMIYINIPLVYGILIYALIFLKTRIYFLLNISWEFYLLD
jgi:alkane 1-monooxygenase